MRSNRTWLSAILATSVLMAGIASAQTQTIDIWPGKAPGTEGVTYTEKTVNTPNGSIVVDVSKPTLTAFLPAKGKATGTGVIIAPGGAFVALAINEEGYDVAKYLQQKGIAAFVLKYRLLEQRKGGGFPTMPEMDSQGKFAGADGVQALKVLRQRAAEFGVQPDRIGIIGFSAGATVTTTTLLDTDAAARPKFAALVYGGPFGGPQGELPKNLPPVFLAWAQDDQIGVATTAKMYEALTKAGYKPEAHAYTSGGHAFGAKKQGKGSDLWIESYYAWLDGQGLTKPAAKK